MDKQPLLTRPPVILSLVLVCALLWGSAFPLVKTGFSMLGIAGNTGGKLYFAAYRFLLAGVLIFGGVLLSGKSIKPPRNQDYATLLLLGLLQTTFQYTFFYIGLSNTTAVKAAIISGAGSFFLAVTSHLWVKDDTLTLTKNIGLIMGFVGIVLVNLHRDKLDFEFHFYGEGFIIIATLAGTMGAVIVKKASVRIYPPLLSAYQLTLGSIVLLVISFMLEPPAVIHFTKTSFLLMVYLSVVSAAAFSLWYALIKYNDLTNIAVYRFLIPISGAFLSAALLDTEYLTGLSVVSLALVSGGMLLTSRQKSKTI
jgi:drug/metabolite transporter (DMT)-like permease